MTVNDPCSRRPYSPRRSFQQRRHSRSYPLNVITEQNHECSLTTNDADEETWRQFHTCSHQAAASAACAWTSVTRDWESLLMERMD
ncbi:hypothetical protein Mp_3g12720 [Marchantia polymorpha subsp. ruderalis]|uniref:Uncharacterized protein n=2 Tax=Marchantia polymorpha TaxID=3197 RepID=A0AAF6B060_MARPO|nr:hypothetical protein MARPO_0050s0064 [Marchantia polymorpha]BBN05394.1 hypothetical protein Mp_3g12720 [Marchantia polymorpha subsp. ruderalis]|eukprot:PTQ38607.1 hypothetical protein MARPO_0050s0064 [Marchantia polymorpha]